MYIHPSYTAPTHCTHHAFYKNIHTHNRFHVYSRDITFQLHHTHTHKYGNILIVFDNCFCGKLQWGGAPYSNYAYIDTHWGESHKYNSYRNIVVCNGLTRHLWMPPTAPDLKSLFWIPLCALPTIISLFLPPSFPPFPSLSLSLPPSPTGTSITAQHPHHNLYIRVDSVGQTSIVKEAGDRYRTPVMVQVKTIKEVA